MLPVVRWLARDKQSCDCKALASSRRRATYTCATCGGSGGEQPSVHTFTTTPARNSGWGSLGPRGGSLGAGARVLSCWANEP
jgi:hypothetical protein